MTADAKSSLTENERTAGVLDEDAGSALDYSVHYRTWHDGSIEELQEEARAYQRLLGAELAARPRNTRVLDFGCGFGALTLYLARIFDDVTGVDASAQQIAVAARHNPHAYHLPEVEFPAWCTRHRGYFDLIFLMDVLEHVPVPQQIPFLRRLASTLKPGGVIYIKTPNANSIVASRWRYIDWTHSSAFTEHSLAFVCAHAGLSNFRRLRDDSSLRPALWPLSPRAWVGFILKTVVRLGWRFVLIAEFGQDGLAMPIGINLMVRAEKPPT